MKKLLLSVVALTAIVFGANALTNMCVEQEDGTIVRYDVEKVKQVYYEEIASADTAIADTTGTYAQGVTVNGQVGNYTYVDLGLESGTKWATYNVGATQPAEYGDYFAWGETKPKENYSWETYKWCDGSYDTQTKYCVDSEYGTVDSLATLLAEDDAATANWGEGWRMPTFAEQDELRNGCDWEWTDDFKGSGVAGRIGTSKANGNTIFLPAAGGRYGTGLGSAGLSGYYWSSSLSEDYSYDAYYLYFNSDGIDWVDYNYRRNGQSVRAVVREIDSAEIDTTKTDTITTDTTKIDIIKTDTTGIYAQVVTISGKMGNYTYVDLGLPSGMKWATYNVGASKPTEYGDYFAWGETTPKEVYSWSTYKYEAESYKSLNDGEGSWTGCSKYTIADGAYQYADSVAWYDSKGNFIGDSLTTLLAEDDAATANWGEGWRMPTKAEQDELRNGCDWEWTDDFKGSGVPGRIGTSKVNGNTIFLPAAGCRYGTDLSNTGEHGDYWSSSLFEGSSLNADYLDFFSDYVSSYYNYNRYFGRSVRAVVREK